MAEKFRPILKRPPILVLPAMGWFLWFIVIPLSIVFVYSLATKGPYGGIIYHFQSENYSRAASWLYLRIFWNSIKLAVFTTGSCLAIGYPMAYAMAVSSKRLRPVLMMMVVLPFWTNFVVRVYAIKLLLSEHGPLSSIAMSLGWVSAPISFTNSQFAVWMGMVTNYLPFMVLPLYVALEKFDFTLMEAARDLGASTRNVFFKILVPLTLPGIVTGCIFVFTPALGEFVIPDLLGGSKVMLIGNLITDQFLKSRDWPFGSALSFLLIATVMLSLVAYLRVGGADDGASKGRSA